MIWKFKKFLLFNHNNQAHVADVSYFDQYFTKEIPCITPCEKPINENDQLLFQGFNYTNHRMTE